MKLSIPSVAAADPLLACVLVGLGVDSLSAAPTALRPVGAALGAMSLARRRFGPGAGGGARSVGRLTWGAPM